MKTVAYSFIIIFIIAYMLLCTVPYINNPLTNTTDTIIRTTQTSNKSLVENKSYEIKHLNIIKPHLYDVTLSNGKRYLVKLRGVAGSNEKDTVKVMAELTNAARQNHKSVVIVHGFDKSDNTWIVDLYYNKSERSLSSWLLDNNYAYHY